MNDAYEIRKQFILGLKDLRPKCLTTLTFKKPQTDLYNLYEMNRLIKRRINRAFFGRRKSDLKFLFVVERHSLEHNKKPTYHVHLLIDIDKNANLEISYEKLKEVIFKVCKRFTYESKVDFYSRQLITPHVEDSDNNYQKQISYLLKEFTKNQDCLDLMNSDFKFN